MNTTGYIDVAAETEMRVQETTAAAVADFRSRAIRLCKDRAAEHDDEGRTTQRDLLLELAAELEKL